MTPAAFWNCNVFGCHIWHPFLFPDETQTARSQHGGRAAVMLASTPAPLLHSVTQACQNPQSTPYNLVDSRQLSRRQGHLSQWCLKKSQVLASLDADPHRPIVPPILSVPANNFRYPRPSALRLYRTAPPKITAYALSVPPRTRPAALWHAVAPDRPSVSCAAATAAEAAQLSILLCPSCPVPELSPLFRVKGRRTQGTSDRTIKIA